jgi:subtilase family serine protease
MMMIMLVTLLVILCSSYMTVSKKVFTRPAAAAHHHWSLHHSSNETNDENVVASFIRLTFAVKQQNIDLLDDKLMSVSSTKSKQYGQLLTLKEVQELTDPKPVHIDAVMAFLASHGIDRSDIESSSGFIRTTVTFEQVERILSTKYYTYLHTVTGRFVHRCEQYELPDAIADILDFVSPTIDFPASIRIKTEEQLQQAATTTTTTQQVHNNNPSSLRSLYFVGDAVGGKSKASQGTHCNQFFINMTIIIVIIMFNDIVSSHHPIASPHLHSQL